MLFVEAKWLYNDILTFSHDHDINDYDTKILTVQGLDKDRQPVIHELQYISSQMKQSIIQGIKDSLKALATLRENNRKIGSLRYKSDYVSINLKQHRVTYRFYDEYHIGIQGFKERIRIRGASQFWNIPDSVLGLVKTKLVKHERVTVLSSREPTTKYCPCCGKLKKDITLSDRVYECECGYKEDRDVHAARNMILLAKINTCGTQEINAFGEDVRLLQNIAEQPQ